MNLLIFVTVVLFISTNYIIKYNLEILPNYLKEILLLFILITRIKSVKNIYIITTLFFAFSFGVLLLLISYNGIPSISSFRNYILLLVLLFASLEEVSFKRVNINKLLFLNIIIIYFIITGIIEYYFFHIELSYLKGVINYIDEAGYVVYITPSYRIEDEIRMSGLQNGPNEYGTIMSLFLALQIQLLIPQLKNNFRNKALIYNLLVHIIGLFCLFMSFSRAGMFVYILLAFDFFKRYSIHRKYEMILISILISSSLLILFTNDKVKKVIVSTLSGEELSAIDRQNQFINGLNNSLNQILPNGFGTTDNRFNSVNNYYFVESGVFNMIHEIGLVFFFILVVMFLSMKYDKRTKDYNKVILFSSLFTINYLSNTFLLIFTVIVIIVIKNDNI